MIYLNSPRAITSVAKHDRRLLISEAKRFSAVFFFLVVTLSLVRVNSHAGNEGRNSPPQAPNTIRIPLCAGLTIGWHKDREAFVISRLIFFTIHKAEEL